MGTVKRKGEYGMLKDVRSGKDDNRKKWSDQIIDSIKKDIESVPAMHSHYCKK